MAEGGLTFVEVINNNNNLNQFDVSIVGGDKPNDCDCSARVQC